MYPADLKYTKDHEWLKPMDGGMALVGITHYAQDALGDVVFVKLPEAGDPLMAGDDFGEVESVKTVSELFSPVDGQVLEVNTDLEAHPEWVNEDPYGKGWMLKIKVGAGSVELLDASAYERLVSAEGH